MEGRYTRPFIFAIGRDRQVRSAGSAIVASMVGLNAQARRIHNRLAYALSFQTRRSMNDAQGIHDHPWLKLGLRPPKNARALRLGTILTGEVPEHPIACDHFGSVPFALDTNDRFGVCGPTSVDNLIRLVTAALLGQPTIVPLDAVYDLYRRSGNPGFDPATGEGDNGVDMQTMLEALLQDGINGIKPLVFAKVDVSNDAEMDAATSIFGGTLWGVTLMDAQKDQSNQSNPTWTYQNSPQWGGHAIVEGKYDESAGDSEVISWQRRIKTTADFRRNQLSEAWVVAWEWNMQHPAFQAGIDVPLLEQAFQQMTGRSLGS